MKQCEVYKQCRNGNTHENSRRVEVSTIRGFALLKPEIFAHTTAVSLSLFLHPQALASLAPARLEFSNLCQNRPISSAFKKKLFKGLDSFQGGKICKIVL